MNIYYECDECNTELEEGYINDKDTYIKQYIKPCSNCLQKEFDMGIVKAMQILKDKLSKDDIKSMTTYMYDEDLLYINNLIKE